MNEFSTLFPLDAFNVKKYSFSDFAVFLQCKFRYKAKYVDKRLQDDERDTFYLSVGRTVHRALAELYRPGGAMLRDPHSVEKLLRDRWRKDDFSSTKEEKYWLEKAIKMVNRFIQEDHFLGVPLAVERKFENKVDEFYLSSIIDRIDRVGNNEYEIIDYKVGGDVTPQMLDNNLQWAFHYLASREILQKEFRLRPRAITFYFLEVGLYESIIPDDHRVEIAISKIKEMIKRIENERNYPPTLNKFCLDCKFDLICPAIKDLNSRGINLSEELKTLL